MSEKGPNPNWRRAIIALAIEAVLVVALAWRAYIDATDDIHRAAVRGDAERVKLLLALRLAEVDERDSGRTPLMDAAVRGHMAVVEALLASGANVNAKEKRKRTALHLASAGGHGDVLHLLLESGAHPSARSYGRCSSAWSCG